jgi:hypothetical protein
MYLAGVALAGSPAVGFRVTTSMYTPVPIAGFGLRRDRSVHGHGSPLPRSDRWDGVVRSHWRQQNPRRARGDAVGACVSDRGRGRVAPRRPQRPCAGVGPRTRHMVARPVGSSRLGHPRDLSCRPSRDRRPRSRPRQGQILRVGASGVSCDSAGAAAEALPADPSRLLTVAKATVRTRASLADVVLVAREGRSRRGAARSRARRARTSS